MPRKGYRKPAAEARTISVNVRLTPHEKSALMQHVEASDVSGIADFIRHLISGAEIKRRPQHAYAKLIDQLAMLNRKLASIDNNLNQLARIANSGGRVAEIDLQQALDHHKALKALAASALQQVVQRR